MRCDTNKGAAVRTERQRARAPPVVRIDHLDELVDLLESAEEGAGRKLAWVDPVLLLGLMVARRSARLLLRRRRWHRRASALCCVVDRGLTLLPAFLVFVVDCCCRLRASLLGWARLDAQRPRSWALWLRGDELTTAPVVSEVRLARLDHNQPRFREGAVYPVVVEGPVAQVLALVAAPAHVVVVLLLRGRQGEQELAALVLVLRQLARRVAVHMRLRELPAVGPATHALVRDWDALVLLELSLGNVRQALWAGCGTVGEGFLCESSARPAPAAAPRTAAVSQSAGGALLLSILRGQQAVWTQQCAGSGQWGAPPPASRSALRHGRGQHGPRHLDDRHRRRGAPPTVCRGAPLEPHTPRTATPSTLGSPELARGPQTSRADDEEEQGAARPAQPVNAADCGRACSALDP